jgi:hypothetical protein
MPGGCPGDDHGVPVGSPGGTPILKNHALAQSLLSRFFSWDVNCFSINFPSPAGSNCPYSWDLGNDMGCLNKFYKSLSLYYTKMCFKILNFLGRKSVFLLSNLHYLQSTLVYVGFPTLYTYRGIVVHTYSVEGGWSERAGTM